MQYHALGILYFIRKSDKLAVSKLIAKFSKQTPLRSPLAYCLLVRVLNQRMCIASLLELVAYE